MSTAEQHEPGDQSEAPWDLGKLVAALREARNGAAVAAHTDRRDRSHGAGVRLYQGVTLGARRFPVDEAGVVVKGPLRHPILEDDVVIYAGATGNVWVTQRVPAGSHISQAKMQLDDLYESGGDI